MELAAQRISLVKVGGIAADVILVRLGRWAAAKQPTNPDQPESWPPQIRAQADSFAERLRAHALRPPVIHFVEWADLWSMGDLFLRVLTPRMRRLQSLSTPIDSRYAPMACPTADVWPST